MSFGIKITNDNGYLTFSDINDYYFYRETLGSANATVQFEQRFYWTTSYDGATVPLVFIYSNGYFASIIDTFRNANGTWQIHVWCDWQQATNTKNNIQGYVFSQSTESISNPIYGIRINNSSGNRVFDSDMQIVKVKDFVTVPAASTSYPDCNQESSGVYYQQAQNHGVTGLVKPAAILYSNGGTLRSCSVFVPGFGTFDGCNFSKCVHKITSTQILTGWAYMGKTFIQCNSNNYRPISYITPVIDGNDY